MKRCVTLVGLLMLVLLCSGAGNVQANGKEGEKLFKKHCAVCHPDGGNIINPKKTLKKGDMEKNGIKTKDDIVNLLRKPGPGMNAFDEKTLSAKDAKEVAEYILKKFGK